MINNLNEPRVWHKKYRKLDNDEKYSNLLHALKSGTKEDFFKRLAVCLWQGQCHERWGACRMENE